MKKKGLDSQWMIIIIAFAALIIYRKLVSTKVDTGTEDGDPGQGYSEEDEDAGVQPAADPDLHVVCQQGSQGNAVKKIQQRMNTTVALLKTKKAGRYHLENNTMHKYYRDIADKENGIKADGIFGPKTLHLCKVLTGKNQISLFTARKKYVIWKDQPWKKESDTYMW